MVEKFRYMKSLDDKDAPAAVEPAVEKAEEAVKEAPAKPVKLCGSCGFPLAEVNTMAVLLTTRSKAGKVSEAKVLFEVCDNCFMDAQDQLAELKRSMEHGEEDKS
jgi:heterodisulfide reductase subunit B